MCFFETIRWATRKADAFLMKDRSASPEPSPAFVISSICPSMSRIFFVSSFFFIYPTI